jgi:hypothetical protein
MDLIEAVREAVRLGYVVDPAPWHRGPSVRAGAVGTVIRVDLSRPLEKVAAEIRAIAHGCTVVAK